MKKIIGLIIVITGVVLIIVGTFDIVQIVRAFSSANIIGGADKPTAYFIISKAGIPAVVEIVTGAILLAISIILLVKSKHGKGKKINVRN